MQDCQNRYKRKFYKKIINYIKDGDNVLNIGCGKFLNFEKELLKIKKVKITCCDLIKINKISPDTDFLLLSAEEKFRLKNKFDIIVFFELIEHLDKTDTLLKNCYDNLKEKGYLIFSFPNLSSLYSRIELLLGFQPHILEISNEYGNFGTGIFGRFSNPDGGSIHHIRGITQKAMKELIKYHGFKLEKILGHSDRVGFFFNIFPELAPTNIFVCTKNDKKNN